MAAALAAALLGPACAGEDRPAQVEVIGGAGVVSVSGAGEGPGGLASGIRYTTTVPDSQAIAFQAAHDLRDIRSVINVAIDGRPVEWSRATDLYERGRNQKRADGTVRSLAALATDDVHAMFPNGAAVYGRERFIDGLIRDGLAGTGSAQRLSDDARRALVDRAVQMLLYGNALRALAEAQSRVERRAPDAGAAVDEAWGFVAGVTDSDGTRPRSLLQAGVDQENAFKLAGTLTRPLEAAFITGLAAAVRGDAATFSTYHAEARGGLSAIFYLATLRGARAVETATSESAREARMAESLGAFQAIRATVAAASPTAADAIQSAYTRPASQPFPSGEVQRVYEALNEPAVLRALGIPAAVQVRTPPAS